MNILQILTILSIDPPQSYRHGFSSCSFCSFLFSSRSRMSNLFSRIHLTGLTVLGYNGVSQTGSTPIVFPFLQELNLILSPL